jgi:iron complex outermembrane recepter protein
MTFRTNRRDRGARRARLIATTGLASLLAMGATSAFAQDSTATAASEPVGLQEIVVTARKRAESLQDVPVAVIAMAKEELANRNIRTIEQVAASVPQFVVARGSSGSGANLSVRGIGSNFTSIGIEQSVSINVDGVYYGQGRVLNEGLFDMEQVEILKGPQALFFGKNATAGAVSFTTAGPTHDFQVLGRAGYEFRTHEKFVEGAVSGPISDTLGARLAIRYSDMDRGYVRNQGVGGPFRVTDTGAGGAITNYTVPPSTKYGPMERNLNVRGTVRYEPSDNLSVVLKGSHSNRQATTPGFLNELFLCPIGGTSQLNPGNECNKDWKSYWDDLPAGLVQGNALLAKKDGRLYDDYNSTTFTGTVNYETDPVTINWVNGYQRFHAKFLLKSDATTNANRGTYAGTDTVYEAYSSELRAQTTFDGPINFLTGLYYQSSKLEFVQDILFPGSAAGGHLINSAAPDASTRALTVRKDGDTDGDTYAIFGQVQWKFTPSLELTAGGRYTHETKDSLFRQPYVHPGFRAAFQMYDPAVPGSQFLQKQTFNDFSPEVILRWKPRFGLMVYGGYKTGYKSGGFSISGLKTPLTSINDLTFGPETVEGWEAGVRSTLFDNRVRLNLTAFSYDYNDLQVDFFNSTITTFVTFNAGTARTQGIEVDGEWAPMSVPGLVLKAALAYNDAKYTNFPGAPCYAGQTPAMGCLPANAAFNYVHQNLKGVHTQLAPTWAGTLGADYDHDIGDTMKFGVSANIRYSGKYLVSPFGNPLDTQKSFTTLDASLRVGSKDDRWQIAIIGKNLTNEYVLNAAQDAPSTGAGTGTAAGVPADQYGFPALPRTVAVQLTVRY